MKSPKQENSGGRKFQNRLPGEKRARKTSDEASPKTEKSYTAKRASGERSGSGSFGNDRPRGEKSYGDRPRGGSYNSDRPRGGTYSTDRSRGNRSEGSRFEGEGSDKPRGERSFNNDRPRGGSYNSDRPRGEKSFGDRPRGGSGGGFNRSNSDRPNSDRGGFDKPRNERSGGGRFGNDRPRGEKSYGSDRPRGGSYSSDRPRGNRSEGSRFGGEGSDKPRGERSYGSDRPRGGSYNSDRPRGEKSFGDRPRGGSGGGFNRSNSDRPSSDRGGFNRGGDKPYSEGRKFGNSERSPRDSKFDRDSRGRGKSKKKDNFQEAPRGFKGSRKTLGKISREREESLLSDGKGEIRLNRYIANSGICSRREADELISQGLVKVNGEVVTELGTKVTSRDDIRVEDRRVTPEKPVYILLNKPKGYITSTSDPDGRSTVMDLIDLPGKERIYPVGRLDRNTTGVLLLTNDGELSQKLMHPSFEIKKIYRATLDKKPTKEHMLAWVEGVELEDGWMTFEQIGWVEEGIDNVLGIEIKSGRNRIVRRMFEHFGYDVTSLDRVMLGDFDKLKLGRGKWRFLTEKEMNYIQRIKRMK